MKIILNFLGKFEERIAYSLLIILTVLLFIQILNRYLFKQSYVWLEECARISFVWLIYFAVAIAVKENRHVRVGIVDLFLPSIALRYVNLLADLLWVLFNAVMTYFGIVLVESAITYHTRSPVTETPMALIYSVIPFCFALMVVRVIYYNIKNWRDWEKMISKGQEPTCEI
jgi:C4-dicarboxylate transporter DctQ subunit